MNKTVKYLLIIFIAFLILLIPVLIYLMSTKQGNKLEENITNYVISTIPIEESKKESKLNKIFSDNFGKDTDYSVVIKNFKTGEEFEFNEKKEYNSASLYKLWVFAVVMQKIKNGEIDPDEVMSGDKNKFDETLGIAAPIPTGDNPTEEVENIEPVIISMKVSDAVEKMITESDNYAALLLTQKVGYRNVDAFLEKYGFNNSNFGSPPKTTASDIASFYESLYSGEIIDKSNSKEMIEVLKRQTLNDRIPKYLPEDILRSA